MPYASQICPKESQISHIGPISNKFYADTKYPTIKEFKTQTKIQTNNLTQYNQQNKEKKIKSNTIKTHNQAHSTQFSHLLPDEINPFTSEIQTSSTNKI